MKIIFGKILCFVFGHSWLYGGYKGMQGQPTQRACKRCGKVENFHGSMCSWPGTFNQLWYSKKDWYTKERWRKYLLKEKAETEKFNDLTKGL
jgi:hypothetical protein